MTKSSNCGNRAKQKRVKTTFRQQPRVPLTRSTIQALTVVFGLFGMNTFALETNSVLGGEITINELDAYLEEREARFPDIVKGTEKTIMWADGVKQTPISIVYLHGFSATRGEISPVTENLGKELGANIYFARLRGHGRGTAGMNDGNVEDWKLDTLEAFEIAKLLGERVVIISASTGGTLSTWLTSRADPSLDRIMMSLLVSPNFGLASNFNEIIRWDWGLSLAKWMNGEEHYFVPQNELHSLYWTERYAFDAIPPMIHLVDEINEIDVSQVTTPQHFIFSPDDQVIDVDAIFEMADKYTSAKTSLTLITGAEDPGQHVIAGEACSPSKTAEVVELMKSKIIKAS